MINILFGRDINLEAQLAYQEEYSDYEIIDGQVYMMSRPTMSHQRISKNIIGIFDNYLDGKRCEAVLEQDVYLSEEDNFIPDVMIVCNPDIIEEDGIHGVPDLVVEILSKSTAKRDRTDKFLKYEKYGVKEYWIVDPFSKSVAVYLLKDGKFEHDNNYSIYNEFEWRKLTEQERAEAKFEIKVSLYDDFVVQVKDIFERVN